MAKFELFGSHRCPHTQEMREWLERRRVDFVEYDVDSDAAARNRIREISPGQRTVPMLIEDGKLVQVGWQGRGCVVSVE